MRLKECYSTTANLRKFENWMANVIEQANLLRSTFYRSGDFDILYCKYTKILETDILVKSFNDTLIRNSFKILIDKPTKITTSSATQSDFMIICKFELKQVIVCQRV